MIGETVELSPSDRLELTAFLSDDRQGNDTTARTDIAASLATASVEAHAAARPQVEATAATAETLAPPAKPGIWPRVVHLLPTSNSAE